MMFERSLREKTRSLKKVSTRKPLYSCSRIGVAEGSPKKKKIKKERNLKENVTKNMKKHARKSDAEKYGN